MTAKDLGLFVEETCAPSVDDICLLIAEMLSQPIAEDYVSRCICNNCGLYGDIEKEHADKLLEIWRKIGKGREQKNEIDFSKVYFITSHCEVCRTGNEKPNDFNIEMGLF